MSTTRRRFLQSTMAAGLMASAAGRIFAQPTPSTPDTNPGGSRGGGRAAPMKILILGGTGFLGPAIVEAARARGHTVTLFNRGRTRPGLFPDVEKLHGDRDPNKTAVIKGDDGKPDQSYPALKSLEKRSWDVVFDDSGFFPRHVKASAELLAPNIKQYIYISSVSAYKDTSKTGADETAELATLEDPAVETMGAGFANYGGLKALCEKAAEKANPGHTTIVRPGFIVGPDDPTGRFTYWPVRVDKGGDMLAPGTPKDPIQLIDVRDLAKWLVTLAERGTVDTFDALGPCDARLTMGGMLDACQKATPSKVKLTWVPASFLEDNHVSAGGDLPIWVPAEGDSAGFHTRNVAKAVGAGLTFRPIEETCKDTLAWYRSLADSDKRKQLAGLSDKREAELLAKWNESGAESKPKTEPGDSPKK